MKTQSAILWEMGRARPYAESRPMTIEDVDLAPPGPGEVLVQIKAAGVCHSDLSVVNGDRPRPTPMALGHEAAGIVMENGPGESDLAPGDRVVAAFVPSCGHCKMCAAGRPGLCEPGGRANIAGTLLSGARRISRNGKEIHHHLGVSAFSRHVVVSRRSLTKVRADDLSFEELALFGCAVMTGAGAVFNTAKVPPGASVCIVGLGGVGLCALLAAKMMGCRPLMAADTREDKLKIARQLGASDTFDAADPECAEKIRKASGGGAEFAFEMAGNANAMDLAYRATARGGLTASAGLSNPASDFALKHVTMVAEERTIKGSFIGGCAPARDIPRLIGLYRDGLLPLKKLLTARLPLEDINLAMDQLSDGKAIRQIVVP